MSIRIITESASDISQMEATAQNITVLPLKTLFGSEEFLDGVTMTHQEFYQRLIESDTVPTTSLLSPFDYDAAFRTAADAGDEVLCITVSSKLSGCYQSASIAAESYGENVVLVDSENVAVGQRILVQLAITLRDEGRGLSEIRDILEAKKKRIRLIALLDTLEYLKLGGRISAATAAAGKLLGIKPVVAIEEGSITVLGKVRGSKNGNNMLIKLVNDCGGIDFGHPFCLAYTGLDNSLLRKYMADSAFLYEGKTDHLPVSPIGSTIGTHAGPGAIAVAFFAQDS